MKASQRQHLLQSHPDTETIIIGGQERLWFVGRISFKIAEKQHGVKMEDVFRKAEEGADNMDQLTQLLWIGLLPFDEKVTLAWVETMLSFTEMLAITPLLTRYFEGFAGDQDAIEEAAGEAGAEGKPQEVPTAEVPSA